MADETEAGTNEQREKDVALRQVKAIGMAIGKMPSGLYVLTVKHEEREDATLVSWVNQCAFSPPAVSIVIAKVRPTRLLLEASGFFILNVLGKAPNSLLKHFLKPKPGQSIFAGVNVRKGMKEINILTDSIAYMECKIINQVTTGDHVVYIAEIVGGRILKGGDPHTHVRASGYNY